MFGELIGNETTKATLARFIGQGRLPHALGLEGPAGSGKRTLARLVAGAAVCAAQPSQRPCGQCAHCRKAQAGVHPDIVTLSAQEGKASISIDAVRHMRSETHLTPNEAAVRVFLVEDAHKLTPQGQNALLKVIEEPPAGVTFILTYTGRGALLSTIRSRLVTVGVEEPTVLQCAQWLAGRLPEAGEDLCRQAAQLAQGNIGKALELVQNPKALELAQHPVKLVQALKNKDGYSALVLLSGYEKKREEFQRLLEQTGNLAKRQAAEPFKEAQGNHCMLTALQAVNLADIIEEAAAQTAQNVGLNLVSARLCAAAMNRM